MGDGEIIVRVVTATSSGRRACSLRTSSLSGQAAAYHYKSTSVYRSNISRNTPQSCTLDLVVITSLSQSGAPLECSLEELHISCLLSYNHYTGVVLLIESTIRSGWNPLGAGVEQKRRRIYNPPTSELIRSSPTCFLNSSSRS